MDAEIFVLEWSCTLQVGSIILLTWLGQAWSTEIVLGSFTVIFMILWWQVALVTLNGCGELNCEVVSCRTAAVGGHFHSLRPSMNGGIMSDKLSYAIYYHGMEANDGNSQWLSRYRMLGYIMGCHYRLTKTRLG